MSDNRKLLEDGRRAGIFRAVFGLFAAAAMLLLPAFARSAGAFPWDIDMYRQESLKANEIARSPVEGTVPVGRRPFTLTLEEAEKVLENPVEFSFYSAWRGRRLWSSNCTPCHGASGAGGGAVAQTFPGIPNLLDDLYKGRTDGRIFAIIELGGTSMPRYGYKFSDQEQWDIVNYLRFLQGKDVAGLERPAAEK